VSAARRSTWSRALRAVAATLLLARCAAAIAGQACEPAATDTAAITRSLALAENIQRSLDASGAQVVLLARAGQDLRKYGLTYSHLGFAYLETPPAAPAPVLTRAASLGEVGAAMVDGAPPPPAPRRGVWRIAHKLNQCGTAEAALYRQGLSEFFMDGPFRYQAAYVVLAPEAQAALLPLLKDDVRLQQWHTPAYSVVSYPWATTYQQSNQWALETLAGALEPAATTRARAQAWLQLHDYQPTVLHLDAFTRLGARMTKANVAFDDHPNAKRFSDHIETVTVESMFDWLQRSGLGAAPVTVR
jgi:hypothetical protein